MYGTSMVRAAALFYFLASPSSLASLAGSHGLGPPAQAAQRRQRRALRTRARGAYVLVQLIVSYPYNQYRTYILYTSYNYM